MIEESFKTYNSDASIQFSSVNRVQFFVTSWTAAHQASLSITISQSLFKLISIELVMPSSHLILCCPFSSCPQSLPASGSFPVSQLFASGGQSIRASASGSDLPMNNQGWFPLGLTDESITPNKTNTFKICSQNRFRLCIISIVNKLHRGVPALPWLWSTALNTIL